MKRFWAAALVAGALAFPAEPGFAQAQPSVVALPQLCTSYDGRREARDAKIMAAAEKDFARGGFAALARRVKVLEAVLANAPTDFKRTQECKMEAALIGSLMAASKQRGPNKVATLDAGLLDSPYPKASFFLGSHAIQTGDHARAATVLLKGLAMEPENPFLASEGALALIKTGRLPEALTVLERALAGEALDSRHRARLLRTKGFALIETKRLDEAEQAYRASLDIEAGHAGAIGQLAYIAGLRNGEAVRTPGVTTSGEFRGAVQPSPGS